MPVLVGMAAVVAVSGGLVRPDLRDQLGWAPWVMAGFLALNTLGNFASRSPGERWVFGPVTAVLTVLVALLAGSMGGAD